MPNTESAPELLNEIYERRHEWEITFGEQADETTKKINAEKKSAENVRMKAMERLHETKKRPCGHIFTV